MARRGRKSKRLAPLEPIDSAKLAGLRYVTDRAPGFRRKRAGRGFSYTGVDGRAIRAPEVLRRIQSLAIPPAWTEVWICPTPSGHIQASGRDARGRKQYRYHPRWRQVRDETKYGRMVAFGEALPLIRGCVDRDLSRPGLPREKVLATVVRLLETTFIRVGNEEYARANDSYGLTTLRNGHVEVSGAKLKFRFRGKGGKVHDLDLSDRRLAGIVRRCQDIPGYELFQYLDQDGETHPIDSADVNQYLRDASGQDFTAKDFRTWAGTLLTARALAAGGSFGSDAEGRRLVAECVRGVAQRLRNTPAICRKHYIHPYLIHAYLEGSLGGTLESLSRRRNTRKGLSAQENALLRFLAGDQGEWAAAASA